MVGLTKRPLVIAHRGASSDAPENTIAAFELALEQGADALEMDIHLSKDGHPVVIHDFTLERTTDGVGPVSARTVRELKRLDGGGWHGRSGGVGQSDVGQSRSCFSWIREIKTS